MKATRGASSGVYKKYAVTQEIFMQLKLNKNSGNDKNNGTRRVFTMYVSYYTLQCTHMP